MNFYDESSEQSQPTKIITDNILGIIDHYNIIKELGAGGFGVVYLVLDTTSNTYYAIKTLHPLLRNNEEIENIRQQFSLVRTLNHSNIAPYIQLHAVQNVVYFNDEVHKKLNLFSGDLIIIMKYAPGVTLSKWRKQFDDGKVPVDTAVDICKQVAAALDYAHSKKIIHRDIKPSNIMIDTLDSGKLNAEVLDFGLAAEIRSSMARVSNEPINTSGTMSYMAPEQWRGETQNKQTDQYALACMLYDLITGAVPFSSVFATGDNGAILYVIENKKPKKVKNLTRRQNKVLFKALSKKPNKRWDSCAEFINKFSSTSLSKCVLLVFAFVILIGIFVLLLLNYVNNVKANQHDTPEETPITNTNSVTIAIDINSTNTILSGLDKPTNVTNITQEVSNEDVLTTTNKLVQINYEGKSEQSSLTNIPSKEPIPPSSSTPTPTFSLKLKGIEYLPEEKVYINGESYVLNKKHEVITNTIYEISFKKGYKIYDGKLKFDKIDWDDNKEMDVELSERKMPKQKVLKYNGLEFEFILLESGLYFGKTLVTQEQWQKLMMYNPSEENLSKTVNNVSYEFCQDFIKILNDQKFGFYFMLPSKEDCEIAYKNENISKPQGENAEWIKSSEDGVGKTYRSGKTESFSEKYQASSIGFRLVAEPKLK